jgi:hypothetical protein
MSAPPGSGTAVPLLSRRREGALLFQQVQHALPGVALFMHGLERLRREPHGWPLVLSVAEVVTSVLVFGFLARAMRRFRAARSAEAVDAHEVPTHAVRHHVDRVDLFLAAMLAVEVWSHWHETGHVRRPTLLLVPIMLAFGLLHGRIEAFSRRRRALRVGAEGLTIGGKLFTRFTASWAELDDVEIGPRRARLVRKDGRVREINLADLRNAADVRAVLEQARTRVTGATTPPAAASADPPASPAAPAATPLPASSHQSPGTRSPR